MTRLRDPKELDKHLDLRVSEQRLEVTLTHGSIHQLDSTRKDNRTLAFLGDAVIELAVRRELFDHGLTESPGQLSIKADDAVRNKILAAVGRGFDLQDYVDLGPGAENARRQDRVVADAFEAMVGAVFLERDLASASALTIRLLRPFLPPHASSVL